MVTQVSRNGKVRRVWMEKNYTITFEVSCDRGGLNNFFISGLSINNVCNMLREHNITNEEINAAAQRYKMVNVSDSWSDDFARWVAKKFSSVILLLTVKD
jgi:hypothetical protein